MHGCEEFEIAIEKRRLDALDPDEGALLDEHLAACESCRRYAQLAGQTEEIMATITKDALEGVDWNRVSSRVRQMAEQYSRGIPKMVLLLIVLVPVIGWASGWGAFFGAAGLGAAILALRVWTGRARVREAVQSERTKADLFRFYRSELDRRIASVRRVNVIEFAIGAFLVVMTAVKVSGLVETSEPTRLIVFQAIFGFVLLGLGLYRRLVQLPRMKSERSEIS